MRIPKIIVTLVNKRNEITIKKDTINMTLRHVFTMLAFAGFTLLGLTSCNDEDYEPITLEVLSGAGQLDNNVLNLDAFSPGESFYIVGGNGRYLIENQSKDIVDYRYDGHTLTFIPVGVGEATVIISDQAGNKMTLTIKIDNHTSFYQVYDLKITECKVGEDMTVGQLNELKKQILEKSIVKAGGQIRFTYFNQEQNLGNVTIHPTPSGRPLTGNFHEETKINEEKISYQEFTITFADNSTVVWKLINYSTEEQANMVIKEDVTKSFKGAYPQLEKAELTYKLTD